VGVRRARARSPLAMDRLGLQYDSGVGQTLARGAVAEPCNG